MTLDENSFTLGRYLVELLKNLFEILVLENIFKYDFLVLKSQKDFQ